MGIERSSAKRGPHVRVDEPVSTGDLRQVLSSAAGDGWRVTHCDGSVLQASRQRPVLRYRVSYQQADSTVSVLKIVIGKGYYRGDGATTFELMRRLWSDGFSEESPLRIPQPIAWIPQTKFLLQGRATGHALYDHLPAPEDGIARVRAAGRWLAKLHGTDVGAASSPLPPRFEADKLTVYSTALAEGYPRLGKQVQDITAAVVGALTGTDNGPMVPTHGDYQPKNIYVTRRQTTVIDFDRHALAPPARDLAHFIGQCMTMSWVRTGSFDRIAPWNDAFLRAYTRRRGDGLELLPAYLARTFLEILYYKLVVKPVADPSFAPAWLAQCDEWAAEAERLDDRSPGAKQPGLRPSAGAWENLERRANNRSPNFE